MFIVRRQAYEAKRKEIAQELEKSNEAMLRMTKVPMAGIFAIIYNIIFSACWRSISGCSPKIAKFTPDKKKNLVNKRG